MHDDSPDKKKTLLHKALEGAAAERVTRFGNAVKQHIVSYTGKDNESGKDLVKGLKQISEFNTNPEYYEQNIKQQAGFSAEVKAVARKNAEAIVDGSDHRFARTDDLGRVNDQILDIVELDVLGQEIIGQGAQMKYVGRNADELLTKLRSSKYKKYLDADALLAIPDDYYDALSGDNGIIAQKINKLQEEIDTLKKAGNSDALAKKQSQMKDLKKIQKNIRKGGLTSEEAIEARLNPKLSAAKDISKLAHKAGVEQAKTGAIISGSVSIVKNVVACMKGEIEPKDAAVAVAKDTGTGAAVSYATAFTGAVVKGSMQNASSAYVRSLSKTNLASGLVTTTMDIGKTMSRYIRGELTGAQCVEQLGEQGVGELGAAMYASIAVASVSGSGSVALGVIAGIAGSTLGYAAAVAVYQELATSLKEYELAKEERIQVEQECSEAVSMIRQYRQEMDAAVEAYMQEHLEVISSGFQAMDEAILSGDTAGVLVGNAAIQEVLGRKAQFHNQEEFDDMMLSDSAFKL